MAQAQGYPFRTLSKCKCHRPCVDRIAFGKNGWIWCPTATGPFAHFATPRKCLESEAGGLCGYSYFHSEGEGANVFEWRAAFGYDASAIGTGVPGAWSVGLSLRHVLEGIEYHHAISGSVEVEEQFDCSILPDPICTTAPEEGDPWWPTYDTADQEVRLKWGRDISPF